MKAKLIALFVACAFLTSCGTGYSVLFGSDGIQVISPAEPVTIPTKPLITPSK